MNNDYSKNPIIQKVTGATREECISKIISKYGSNYVLDGYETVRKVGFFGFGAKSYIEQSFHVVRNNYDKLNNSRGIYVPLQNDSQSSFANSSVNLSAKNLYGNQNSNPNSSSNDFLKAQAEMLKKLDPSSNIQLSQVTKKLDKIQSQLEEISSANISNGEHKTLERINELLDDNGFTRSYSKMIETKIKQNFSLEELNDFDLVQKKVVDWIGENIKIQTDEYVRPPRVIIIVGPTGVGKTTTVAKMAAEIAISAKNNPNVKYQPSIEMVSTDTMRVAAVDQLSHYGEIIHANVEQAENSEQLQEIYNAHSSSIDYMFIDTSGYSPNDFEHIASMRRILDVKNMHESIYLAVLAGISAKDLENILRNYESFNFKSVIVTKCDETLTFGNLLSVLYEKKKTISYLTTGQEVVNNIEKANPLFFLKKLRGFNLDMEHLKEKFLSDEEQKNPQILWS